MSGHSPGGLLSQDQRQAQQASASRKVKSKVSMPTGAGEGKERAQGIFLNANTKAYPHNLTSSKPGARSREKSGLLVLLRCSLHSMPFPLAPSGLLPSDWPKTKPRESLLQYKRVKWRVGSFLDANTIIALQLKQGPLQKLWLMDLNARWHKGEFSSSVPNPPAALGDWH